jgi:hypothetical protein
MPTLVSPGVSSYIVDESIYISNNAGATVPLFFVATKANKETYPGSNVTAPGTLESGVIRSVTSVAQLVALYGIPSFRSTVNAGVTLQHHGDCRNEYGLFAAYQFLQNGGAYCFVVRADIDLTDEPLDSNVTAKRVGTTIYGPTNTGNGTVGSITVSQATAKVETWTLTAMSASVFTVEGSVSGQGANAVVGVPYTNGAISFTITAGATPFALGDVIEIPVIDTPVYAGTGDGTIAGNVVLRSVGEVDTSNATNLPSEDMIGKGTIGQITPSGTAVAETWTLTAQDATTFTVEGSVSGAKPDATVGELYDNGLISFKLYPGATTFVAGDTFEFDVIVQNVIVQPETSTLEVWTIAAVNPTTFSVTGSVTGFTGNATVGTLYDNGKIAFTITAGATPFVAGDTFTVTIARAGGLPPLGVTHASKRTKIVQALQAAVNLNEDVRSEAYEYNLISCPGYPELADELTLLNRSINEEAFIVSGTPMEYNVEQTVNWCATPGRQFNTYIGYYYPHGLASNLDGVDIVCDAAGIALGIIAYSDSQSYLWFAPAGLRRGTVVGIANVGYVSGSLGQPTTFVPVALNQGQRDLMYKDGKNLNPITFFPGRGIVVWGQKTSQSFASALDRINVVRLMCFLKRTLRKGLMPFVFEPNDQITREDAKAVVTNVLNDVMAKRGLYDYAVICDESVNTPDRIDRNEMWVYTAVKPTKAAEFIYNPIAVYNTGDTLPG